jgi:methionyl aminopeptidase
MIKYKTAQEIEIMREAAQIVSRTLGIIAKHLYEGQTPKELDRIAEEYILSQNAKPGFKGLYGCPSTLLISVNEQVVHGLPTDRPFQSGDVVSVDCGSIYKGYYGDHAFTFEVGDVKPEVKKLLEVTKCQLTYTALPPLLLRRKDPPMHNQHCRLLIDTMKSLSLAAQALRPLRNPSNNWSH